MNRHGQDVKQLNLIKKRKKRLWRKRYNFSTTTLSVFSFKEEEKKTNSKGKRNTRKK